MKTVATLFVDEPIQWGFRGDPYLWRDMKEHFKTTPLPSSIEEIENLVRDMFVTLTHHPMDSTGIIKIERYNHGGMSGGGISTKFWVESALPLLRRRFSQAQT